MMYISFLNLASEDKIFGPEPHSELDSLSRATMGKRPPGAPIETAIQLRTGAFSGLKLLTCRSTTYPKTLQFQHVVGPRRRSPSRLSMHATRTFADAVPPHYGPSTGDRAAL